MKIYLIFIFFWGFQIANGQMFVPADDPLIRYSGRIDFSDQKKPAFSYSGINIKASFTGTSISMKMENLSDENYYFILVDHNQPYKLRVTRGESEYNLARGLKDTSHVIEIIKITECLVGRSEFEGFIIQDGKSLYPLSEAPNKKILFIGNSITCGYGIEAPDQNEKFSAATENHYYSYPSITARNFGAEYQAVCRSGIGIYRNYGVDTAGSPDCMPNIYDGVYFDSIAPKWDPGKFIPELICINLGTNDFWDDKVDEDKFKNNYISFINKLRGYYPSAKLVMLTGPMLGENKLAKCKAILSNIKDYFISKHDKNIYLLNLSTEGDLGYGADWHPSILQSRKNADELTIYLCKLMGWALSPTRDAIMIKEK